jgi:hypothetical protein
LTHKIAGMDEKTKSLVGTVTVAGLALSGVVAPAPQLEATARILNGLGGGKLLGLAGSGLSALGGLSRSPAAQPLVVFTPNEKRPSHKLHLQLPTPLTQIVSTPTATSR